MQLTSALSDKATLTELGDRIARYRLNQNLSQQDLATESGVSLRTIHRMEHGHSIQALNLIRILRALQLSENLEALVPPPQPSPVQRLKMQGKVRKRASTHPKRSRQTHGQTSGWSWVENE